MRFFQQMVCQLQKLLFSILFLMSGLFPCLDGFGKYKFYLTVNGAEIVLRPLYQFFVKRSGQSEGHLFFNFFIFIFCQSLHLLFN